MNYVAVGLGGMAGSMLRYLVSAITCPVAGHFPLATLIVNLVGCAALGLLMGYNERTLKVPRRLMLFAGTGMAGSFTTFSALSTETVQLLQSGLLVQAALYIMLTALLGFMMAFIGYSLGNRPQKEAEQ